MAASSFIVSAIAAAIISSTSISAYDIDTYDYRATDNVGIAMQLPDYPAGCEPMSLCILLKSYEYDAVMPDIMDYFDMTSNDYVNGYWGSIYSVGAAYPTAIVEAADRYLVEEGSKLRATDLSGSSWSYISDLIQDGKPVMAWCTTDYQPPLYMDWVIEGQYMYANEHCVVVYKVENGAVYISDPLRGLIEVPAQEFEILWGLCGSMAVCLNIEE